MAKEGGRAGTWLIVTVLLMMLALSLAVLYVGWGIADDAEGMAMSTGGYVAMTLGVVATLALGIGLMALVFYSNRHGDDF